MQNFNEIREAHIKMRNEIKEIENKIKMREQQIVRLKMKQDKKAAKCWWGTSLIRPIMELVKARFPQIVWDDDRLIPMGLCSRISLFGRIDGKLWSDKEDYEEGKLIILCFTPSDTRNGIIAYDTEERKGSYPENSIGAWNDMDKVSEDITDIEQIYKHIEKQLK
jgi:hypothetical protein